MITHHPLPRRQRRNHRQLRTETPGSTRAREWWPTAVCMPRPHQPDSAGEYQAWLACTP